MLILRDGSRICPCKKNHRDSNTDKYCVKLRILTVPMQLHNMKDTTEWFLHNFPSMNKGYDKRWKYHIKIQIKWGDTKLDFSLLTADSILMM